MLIGPVEKVLLKLLLAIPFKHINLVHLPIDYKSYNLAQDFAEYIHNLHEEIHLNISFSNSSYKLIVDLQMRHTEFRVETMSWFISILSIIQYTQSRSCKLDLLVHSRLFIALVPMPIF